MALNIKNSEVERLAAEVAALAGESKTEAIRKALIDRHARLRVRVIPEARQRRMQRFLEAEVWTRVPPEQRGQAPGKKERERILGYGPEGA